MTAKELRKFMYDMYTDISFLYHGECAGIFPEGDWSDETGWSLYKVSYKDISYEYTCFDDLMSARIFDGKTLEEISEVITELTMI